MSPSRAFSTFPWRCPGLLTRVPRLAAAVCRALINLRTSNIAAVRAIFLWKNELGDRSLVPYPLSTCGGHVAYLCRRPGALRACAAAESARSRSGLAVLSGHGMYGSLIYIMWTCARMETSSGAMSVAEVVEQCSVPGHERLWVAEVHLSHNHISQVLCHSPLCACSWVKGCAFCALWLCLCLCVFVGPSEAIAGETTVSAVRCGSLTSSPACVWST